MDKDDFLKALRSRVSELEGLLKSTRVAINSCTTTMDEKGRANEEDNSRMLWFSDWHDMRAVMLNVTDAIDAALSGAPTDAHLVSRDVRSISRFNRRESAVKSFSVTMKSNPKVSIDVEALSKPAAIALVAHFVGCTHYDIDAREFGTNGTDESDPVDREISGRLPPDEEKMAIRAALTGAPTIPKEPKKCERCGGSKRLPDGPHHERRDENM